MTTDLEIDSSLPETDPVSPPPLESPESPEKDTQTEETLEEKLAAAEAEAKMWKGRAVKETKKDKPSAPISEEDLDWKIQNTSRVSLVKDTYQKHLDELQGLGAKLSNPLRDTALRLAEAETGVSKSAQVALDDSLPTPSIDRGGSRMPKLSATDVAMGVKPDTVKEYADYVER